MAYTDGATGLVVIETTKAGAVTEEKVKAALKGHKEMEFSSFKVRSTAKADS